MPTVAAGQPRPGRHHTGRTRTIRTWAAIAATVAAAGIVAGLTVQPSPVPAYAYATWATTTPGPGDADAGAARPANLSTPPEAFAETLLPTSLQVAGVEELHIQPIIHVTRATLDPDDLRRQFNQAGTWLTTVSGNTWTTRPTVIAPTIYTPTTTCDQLVTLAEDAHRAATDDGSLRERTFVALLDSHDCPWAGLGAIGGNWLYLAGFNDDTVALGTLIHELGHTLGLPHSGTRQCPHADDRVPGPAESHNSSGCADDEYGNLADPMGATADSLPAPFGAVNRYRLGWLDPHTVTHLTSQPGQQSPDGTSSTTVTLTPTGRDGTHLVLAGRWAISHRGSTGIDESGQPTGHGIVVQELAGEDQPWDLTYQMRPGSDVLDRAGHWISPDGTVAVVARVYTHHWATVDFHYRAGGQVVDQWAPYGTVTAHRVGGTTLVEGTVWDPSGIDQVTIVAAWDNGDATFTAPGGDFDLYLSDQDRGELRTITVNVHDRAGNLRTFTVGVPRSVPGRVVTARVD